MLFYLVSGGWRRDDLHRQAVFGNGSKHLFGGALQIYLPLLESADLGADALKMRFRDVRSREFVVESPKSFVDLPALVLMGHDIGQYLGACAQGREAAGGLRGAVGGGAEWPVAPSGCAS